MRSRLRPAVLRGPFVLALAVEMVLGCSSQPSMPGDIEAHVVVGFFPQGQEPPGYDAARAVVKEVATGRVITDARVEVNQVPLSYDAIHGQYEGSVGSADSADVFIVANGAALGGSVYATPGQCSIDAPAVLHPQYPEVVRWTWNRVPDGPQGMALIDPRDVNGPLVWPRTVLGHMVTGSDFAGATLEAGTGPEIWQASMTVPSSPGPLLLVVEGLLGGKTFAESEHSDVGLAALCSMEVQLSQAELVGLTIEGPSEVPDTPAYALGNGTGPSGRFRAMGHFSDGVDQEFTDAVGWVFDPQQIIDLHSDGSFDTLGPGTVEITVSYGGFSASTSLVVTPAPDSVSIFSQEAAVLGGGGLVLPRQLSVNLGLNANYGPTANRDVTPWATWFSSNPGVADIGATGVVTTVAPGMAEIRGSYGAKTASIEVQVVDWTVRPAGTWDAMKYLLWTGTQFVAVGDTSTLTSPDGLQWSRHTLPDDYPVSVDAVTWTGTQLVVIRAKGAADGSGKLTDQMLTSPDGLTWSVQAPLPSRTDGVSYRLHSVAGSPTRVVAAGDGAILTSPDGATWTLGPFWVAASAVLWSGSSFLVVDPGVLLASTDGVSWKTGDNPGLPEVQASDGSRMIAVGGGELFTSTDGLSWSTAAEDPSIDPTQLVWTGSEFLGVDRNGSLLTSLDGATWTAQPFSIGLGAIAASPQRTVTFIGRGNVMTRP